MSKRKLPDTSLAAYDSLHPEELRVMYAKIVSALKVLGTATYEQLSDYLNCQDRNQVSRRLKEMEGLQLIWKPGEKRLTKRNRQAYVYQLTGNQPKVETVENTPISNGNKPNLKDIGFKQGSIWFLD